MTVTTRTNRKQTLDGQFLAVKQARSTHASVKQAPKAVKATTTAKTAASNSPPHATTSPRKRGRPAKSDVPTGAPSPKKARPSTASASASAASDDPPLPTLPLSEIQKCTTTTLPPLTFDLDQGKQHLVNADVRFQSLVRRIPMRVFEELAAPKELDLFKTLVTSILGQQVSWLAARAILYKFVRLWAPHLPLQPDFTALPREKLPFPTPLQVCDATVETLRSAGLSGQKVKYIKDIAQRCSDGRLDVRKLVQLDEDQVVQELIQIKGVGIWTAQMLLIFALRRPDVLPVGDLGVQRGVCLLWTAGPQGPAIKSAKARPATPEAEKIEKAVDVGEGQEGLPDDQDLKSTPTTTMPKHEEERITTAAATSSSIATPTPSIPADANLTLAQLTARKNGTKTKGKQYLTPDEMTALCQTWQPYRSLASVIMWGLVDA